MHYSLGSAFDRYLQHRRDGFQKEAHKLNIQLEYPH